MENKQEIIALITRHLPRASGSGNEIGDETILAEVGVRSIDLVSLIVRLWDELELDLQGITAQTMPITIGHLVRLIENSTHLEHPPLQATLEA